MLRTHSPLVGIWNLGGLMHTVFELASLLNKIILLIKKIIKSNIVW